MHGLRLAYNYLRIGILNEFQYRANLYIQILQTFIALGTGLIGLNLVFSQTSQLGGWVQNRIAGGDGRVHHDGRHHPRRHPAEHAALMEEIRKACSTFALTKPADAQLLISVREFRLWQLVDVVTGLIVLGVALSQMEWMITLWAALASSPRW
jgi:ABC-2 type transport system permease protein